MKAGSTDEERYGWVYMYDLANRIVTAADPILAAQDKVTTRYRYNIAGQKVAEMNALGHETTYAYDQIGRLISVTDAIGTKTTYGYDKTGNKLFMMDGRGKVTRYSYGSFGLMREAIDPDNRAIRYKYDIALNTALQVDRNGNPTRMTYDARNQLTSRMVEETGDVIQYSYDEVGNRASMVDESGKSEYRYDANNNLLEIKKDGAVHLTYTYDAINNIASVTDKKGNRTSYTYDKSSRMHTVSFNGKTTTYAYDENGNRTSVAYQGGVKESYTFDLVNRLEKLTNIKPDGTVISSYNYTYDDAGRPTSKTDSFGTTHYTYDDAGRIQKVEAPGKTSVYTYDGSGNRQSFNETYTSEQPSGYVNPMNGEAVMFAIKKSEYIYSSSNQLLKLIERMYNAAGEELLEKTTAYIYDNNGNELRQRVNYIHPHTSQMRQVTGGNLHGETVTEDINNLIEKVSNTYDGFNRLIKVEKVKGGKRHTVEFAYNGDGLRTSKTVRSSEAGYEPQVTNYLYDRQYVILETNAQDEVITRYIKGVNYIARIDDSSRPSYYLLNGHGDVVQTVSEIGQVENQYDYDIFGNPILTVETEYKNAIRYAGEFFDDETGLYYLRARYYDPYIGRFISVDSYWGEDTNPLSLNRYTYTHNDPIQYIDPSGYYCESADGKYSHPGQCNDPTSTHIPDDEYYGGSDDSSSEDSSNSGGSGGSSGNGSGGSGNYDAPPPDLDWDGDGKVDTREEKDSFDLNDNDIADWLEEDEDDNWVFNDSTGWDDINTLDSSDVQGPTAEQIRLMYDEYASYSDDPSEFYRPWGTPNYEIFDKVTSYIKNPMSVERSDIVEIASKVKGMSSETEYIDYLIEHANETFSEKEITKAQELLSKVGFYQGEITGEYNEDFYFAVQAYQKTLNKWDTGVAWQVANKDTWFGKLFGYEGYLDEDGMLNDRLIGIAKRDVELGRNKDGSIYNVLYVGDIIIVSEVAIAVAGEAAIAGAVAYAPRILSYFIKGEKLIEGTGNLLELGTNVLKNFNVDNAFVKTKHLSTTGGNGAKFIGNTKAEAESILKDAMKNGKVKDVLDNGLTKQGNPSFEIIIDAGKTVGTRGETSVKIILSEDGGMLSAYPVK